ncbi:MAG: ABZJ_00895 family protein [Pseudomonadota bacterium]
MIGFICKRYFLYVLATYALMILVSSLLSLVGVGLPSGLSTVLAAMIPAMWAGNTWYKKYGNVPESAVSWKLASYFTLIQLGLAVLMLVILVPFTPELSSLMTTTYLALFAGIFVFLGVVVLLVSRFFFAMSVKNAAKAAK